VPIADHLAILAMVQPFFDTFPIRTHLTVRGTRRFREYLTYGLPLLEHQHEAGISREILTNPTDPYIEKLAASSTRMFFFVRCPERRVDLPTHRSS
jgi:hypothetical protein